MLPRTTSTKEIDYPESDGKPMAETDTHRDWMFDVIDMLKYFFKGRRVYVSGNLLIYYVEDRPAFCFSPDVFAVKGVEQRQRRVYKIWVERKVPNFTLETTSKSTHREDVGEKMELCAQLGVAEYFLYDPLGEWLEPALMGYRLVNGEYVRIKADRTEGIRSKQLGITFRLEEGQLALYNTATGERLKTGREQADEAIARLKALKEELAQLKAERKPRGRSGKGNGDPR